MTNRRVFVRDLAIGVAGLGALGGRVGRRDIGDDVDFTAIYLAVIAGVAWTSRLVVANVTAVAALIASLGADVVAHPPDLGLVLVWNGSSGLAAFAGFAMLVHYAREERDELRLAATHDSPTGIPTGFSSSTASSTRSPSVVVAVPGQACSRSISMDSSRSTTRTGTTPATSSFLKRPSA